MHLSVKCTLSRTCPRTRGSALMSALAAMQEPCLFATSIYNNISYGAPEATSDEIYAAARAANCHAFISKLPEG
jgi:ATP-binding cassette subfamily B protein IrtA